MMSDEGNGALVVRKHWYCIAKAQVLGYNNYVIRR